MARVFEHGSQEQMNGRGRQTYARSQDYMRVRRSTTGQSLAALPKRQTMRLPSFLARWFRVRGTPNLFTMTARGDSAGCKFKASGFAAAHATGGQAEDLFQRRFRQLVAGGWSFRAATVVALFEATINSAASCCEQVPMAHATNGQRELTAARCGS
jgi:hypothetical protein